MDVFDWRWCPAYINASSLQDKVLICTVCGEEIMMYLCNDEEFALLQREHEIKDECSENLFKGHFSNIVLIPRPGQCEDITNSKRSDKLPICN